MKKSKLKRCLVSLLTLVLILLPLISMAVYARNSETVGFGYNFAGDGGTQRFIGTKSDIGESTEGYAGVTVTIADFGAGTCTFSMEDYRQITVSEAYTVNRLGNYTMLYYSIPATDQGRNATVYLSCYAQKSVQAVGGRFQP